MRTLSTLGLLMLLSPSLSGCAALKQVKNRLPDAIKDAAPRVSFKNMKVADIDWDHVDLDFTLAIDNPNPIAVKLTQVSWDVALADKPFTKGGSTDGFELAANGSKPFTFRVGFGYKEVYNLATGLKGADKVPLRVAGDVGFNTPVGEVKLPYKHESELPTVKAPKVGIGKVKLGKVDLLKQTAAATVEVKLTNPSNANIGMKAFQYDLALTGRNVAGGNVAEIPDVKPGQTEVVELPVKLKLLDLGAEIVDIVKNKKAWDVGLKADAKVGTPFGAIPLKVDTKRSVKPE